MGAPARPSKPLLLVPVARYLAIGAICLEEIARMPGVLTIRVRIVVVGVFIVTFVVSNVPMRSVIVVLLVLAVMTAVISAMVGGAAIMTMPVLTVVHRIISVVVVVVVVVAVVPTPVVVVVVVVVLDMHRHETTLARDRPDPHLPSLSPHPPHPQKLRVEY